MGVVVSCKSITTPFAGSSGTCHPSLIALQNNKKQLAALFCGKLFYFY
jgi:hypothetical protein